jgi:hypothetical protein
VRVCWKVRSGLPAAADQRHFRLTWARASAACRQDRPDDRGIAGKPALQPSIFLLIPNLNASQLRRHRNAGGPALAMEPIPSRPSPRSQSPMFPNVSKVPHRKAVLPICETKKHKDIANHDQMSRI